jgi:hypothetical protein
MRTWGVTVSGLSAATLLLVAVPSATAAAGTPTALTASDVYSSWGETASFEAAGLPADATGSVSFVTDGAEVCAADVVEGAVSCSTTTYPEVGTYAVTATYSGDEVYAPSDAAFEWRVRKAMASFHLNTPSTVPRGSRALLRARLTPVSCGPYVACHTSTRQREAVDGVVRWEVVKAPGDQTLMRGRSVVSDGRARFRTPRLLKRGRYIVKARYHGKYFLDCDNRAEFRVIRP